MSRLRPEYSDDAGRVVLLSLVGVVLVLAFLILVDVYTRY